MGVRGPVFLTGMMGSGKSTVGRVLAQELGADFVDLDRRIEHVFGLAIADLFALGEPTFREREHQALATLTSEPGFAERAVVVATGGGVVIDERNRRLMRRAGAIVHLHVGVDELADRLRAEDEPTAGAAGRPLLSGAVVDLRARIEELASTRHVAYRDCDVVVDGAGTPEEVADRVRTALGECDPRQEHEAV
jgi:shikimate kinase